MSSELFVFQVSKFKLKIQRPNCPFQPHGTGLKEANFGLQLILLSVDFNRSLVLNGFIVLL